MYNEDGTARVGYHHHVNLFSHHRLFLYLLGIQVLTRSTDFFIDFT